MHETPKNIDLNIINNYICSFTYDQDQEWWSKRRAIICGLAELLEMKYMQETSVTECNIQQSFYSWQLKQTTNAQVKSHWKKARTIIVEQISPNSSFKTKY